MNRGNDMRSKHMNPLIAKKVCIREIARRLSKSWIFIKVLMTAKLAGVNQQTIWIVILKQLIWVKYISEINNSG